MKLFHENLNRELELLFNSLYKQKGAPLDEEDCLLLLFGIMGKIKEQVSLGVNHETKDCATQKITWTGSKVSLIELIYAMHADGCFNNGNVTLKNITLVFESAFNVSLGNTRRKFIEIRARKSEPARFIDTLKQQLLLRIEKADAYH